MQNDARPWEHCLVVPQRLGPVYLLRRGARPGRSPQSRVGVLTAIGEHCGQINEGNQIWIPRP